MTITEALRAYDVDILYTAGKALKTRKNYSCAISLFVKSCADIPVELISYNHIIEWKLYMSRNGLQPSSIASNLSVLRNVLKYLKSHGYKVLDYREVEYPRFKPNPPTWLTIPEIKQFLEVIESPRDRALFACLFDSAARISELLQLNRDSIQDGEAEIIGKGDKPGKLHFNFSLPILQDYLDTRRDSLRPLFVSGQYRRITVSRVEQLAHQYADMAGLDKNVTPHVFRHSRASDYKLNGADIYDIKEQLRHKSISTTQIYTHITDSKAKADHTTFGTKIEL
jgi:integrase/recombinase XerD